MNYTLQVVELVKHYKLPEWALSVVAEAKMWHGGQVVSSRSSVLSSIKETIESQRIVIRNSVTTGDHIPAVIEDNQLTVYSLTGRVPLLKFFFKPTDREITDPFYGAPGAVDDSVIKQL